MANLLDIIESLDVEGQQEVTSKLIELLNESPLAEQALSAALAVKNKYNDVPKLDLRRKMREIDGLVDRLSRESKEACILTDRSTRDEILEEAVDSLLGWLEDIWRVVFEYETAYDSAHKCLLYAADTLVKLCEIRGPGCKCSLLSIPIELTIHRQVGTPVKTFQVMGLPNLDQVLLWVWRELFMSMLRTRQRKARARIPEMLADIEDALTWQSLEWMLYGGQRSLSNDDGEDPAFAHLLGIAATCDEDQSDPDDDDLGEGGDGELFELCTCNFHAEHWTNEINSDRHILRDLVQDYFMAMFTTTPSMDLYTSLKNIHSDEDSAVDDIMVALELIETHSSDNLAAALEIYSEEEDTEAIYTLLSEHTYLLRPRDAPVHQRAARVLITNSDEAAFRTFGLKTVERELLDTVHALHIAIRASFSGIQVKVHQEELEQILKLRPNTSARQSRIESWVESVLTPPSPHVNTVQFVAAMMGIPVPPGLDEGHGDADPFMYADAEDPDLADLREEFRPQLKERFEGWLQAANFGKAPLKVYKKIIECMPFFRTTDVVDAMMERIVDHPSKQFLQDAMTSVLSFCKLQRKSIQLAAKKKNKLKAQVAPKSDSDSPPPLVPIDMPLPTPPPAPSSSLPATFPFPFHAPPFIPGGIEDVD